MLNAKRQTPPADRPASTAQYVDETAAAGQPITLRINDRPPLLVEDERACQLLWQLVDRIETIEALRRASQQMATDEGVPFDEAMDRLRERFGIAHG